MIIIFGDQLFEGIVKNISPLAKKLDEMNRELSKIGDHFNSNELQTLHGGVKTFVSADLAKKYDVYARNAVDETSLRQSNAARSQ